MTGLGVLTKGIPSLAFQAITILTLFIYHRRFKELFSIWNFLGLACLIGILGSYFYSYHQQNDVLPILTRLLSESAKRSLIEENWLNSIAHLYQFPLLVIGIIAPWAFMTPVSQIRATWKKIKDTNWVRLSLLFLIPDLAVYWLSAGTLDRYLYMFLPFLLFIITNLYLQSSQVFFRWLILLSLVLGIVCAFIIPFWEKELPSHIPWLVSSFIILSTSAITFLYFKKPSYQLFGFIAFLLFMRLSYNFLILPLRSMHRLPYEQYAEILAKHEVDGLQSEEEYYPTQNLLTRSSVPIKAIAHPPYQLSFYYSKLTVKILPFAAEEMDVEVYLKKLIRYESKENHTVLDTLKIGNNKGHYLIYKVNQLR